MAAQYPLGDKRLLIEVDRNGPAVMRHVGDPSSDDNSRLRSKTHAKNRKFKMFSGRRKNRL
jgi:hypothetical protein